MNEEIIHDLNDRLDRTIDKGRSLLADEDLQRRLDEAKIIAESTIRKNPLTSVIAGVAVGFLLARMFRSED